MVKSRMKILNESGYGSLRFPSHEISVADSRTTQVDQGRKAPMISGEHHNSFQLTQQTSSLTQSLVTLRPSVCV